MKRFTILLSALLLSLALALPAWAQEDNQQENNTNQDTKVELTEEQQKELEEIHQGILDKKMEMLDKHVEFGIITQEQGDKIKEKMQKRHDFLKENGFVPNNKPFNHGKCRDLNKPTN